MANGIDTIAISGATDYQSQSGDVIAPPGDATVFTAAASPWGEGDGLNGDILRPEDTESLINILENIEFDATIYQNNYLRHSNLDASINLYDQDGNYLSERNIHNWADSSAAGMASPGGYDFEDQITYSAGTTDINYRENTKNSWTQREILRDIANYSDTYSFNSGNTVDDSISDTDSTYLFIRPESIRNNGIISTHANDTISNPNAKDFDTLSNNAPLTIEINDALAKEISDAVAASNVNINPSDIVGVRTDYGSEPNITIKLSDYQDADGNIDFVALNSDQRLTLELNNNIGQKITDLDDAWAHANFRAQTPDGSHYIGLNALDHDAGNQYASGAAVDFLETVGTDTTVFELGFNEHNLQVPNSAPENAQPFVTYYLESLSTNFNTIGSSTNAYLSNSETSLLTNSIQSITLDLTDWNYNSDFNGSTNVEFSATPLANVIDLSSFDNYQKFVDFDHSDFDYANFDAEYKFVLDKTQTHNSLGNFRVNAHSDSNGHTHQHINGDLHQEITDYSQLDTVLTRLSFHGRPAGDDSSGQVSLNFNYDSANDSYKLNNIDGWGWGDQYRSDNGTGILPSSFQFNWEQFAALEITNIEAGIVDPYAGFEISTFLGEGNNESLELSYNLYQLSDYLNDEPLSGIDPLNQLAVLGDSVDHNSRFVLDINAESLEDGWNIESTDITIQFDPTLFSTINASDIKIGGALPIANAVKIDNENGTIRLAAASLADLGEGSGIDGQEALASISLNFAEENIELLDKNPDGSLMINPLTFDISVNEHETIFSNDYIDDDGFTNREVLSLDQLGGFASVVGQEVTLYEAKINLEQQGDGLVLGTQRVIGSDASYTNLVRKGDTITTDANWLNVGNIEANNLTYDGLWNQNARLINGSFSKTSLASGSFIDGVFVEDAREETTFTADIEITGEAGSVVDLAEGIVAIRADGTSEVFNNVGQGSSNLITFQGDLNYDGRVSMKDLAYLNAGAARQMQHVWDDRYPDPNQDGIVDSSVARDVDADFNGKIDLADLSVLDKDWGKTLHNGDQNFQGSNDVSWDQLDDQGESTSWDNDSFKEQNATEADVDYVGSLESPTSNAIGADSNAVAGDGGIQGEVFQDPLVA